ncbi:MAG TPA: hypothetical protein VIE69_10440 [Methylophilaceae bacterium]|jgi:hypothetical protein
MKILAALFMLCALPSVAATTDEPSVADNIRAMDTDHDGQVSVSEIKVYLQKKYGADYQKDLLELMEKRAYAKSCGSSFTRDLE